MPVSVSTRTLMTLSCSTHTHLPTTVKQRLHACSRVSTISASGCLPTDWNWMLRRQSCQSWRLCPCCQRFSRRFSSCSNLPRRHPHRSGAHICRSYSTTHWSLFSLSKAATFIRRMLTSDTINTLVNTLVVSRIDYCKECSLAYTTSTCGSSNEFSMLQLNWSFTSGSTTASPQPYVTFCIGCRSGSV